MRVKAHGVNYILADNRDETQNLMAYFAEQGGHEINTKLPRGNKFTRTKEESPIVIGSLPFKNVEDLTGHFGKWYEDLKQSRKGKLNTIKKRKAKSGVDLIYLGNIGIETAAKHAAENPENPAWFFGKESFYYRLIPKVDVNANMLSLGFDSYDRADWEYELVSPENRATLHYYDRNEDEFVDTGRTTLHLLHHVQQELDVRPSVTPSKAVVGASMQAAPDPSRPSLVLPQIDWSAFSHSISVQKASEAGAITVEAEQERQVREQSFDAHQGLEAYHPSDLSSDDGSAFSQNVAAPQPHPTQAGRIRQQSFDAAEGLIRICQTLRCKPYLDQYWNH